MGSTAFERFSESAKEILIRAQEEAERTKYPYIGSEHLLLAMCNSTGEAHKILRNMGIEYDETYAEILRLMGKSERPVNETGLIPTQRVKNILEKSVDESKKMPIKDSLVSSGHILLALISTGSGTAHDLLKRKGVTYEKAKAEFDALIVSAPATKQEGTKQETNTPTIDQYCHDFTQAARAGTLDPVIGRSNETERMIDILSRRTKNNPILIGQPGVGKTAIVEGLAQKILSGKVPDGVRDKRVVALDMASVIAGTKYRGEFEERMKKILDELRNNRNVMLFIDEIHTVVGAGAAEGAVDAANIMKPALSRGEIQVIGATTLDEYRKYFERDGALERRFQPITVDPPSVANTILILQGLQKTYESYHHVTFRSETLLAAIRMAEQYVPDRQFPDKAIDLIDEAAARVRNRLTSMPVDMVKAQEEIEALKLRLNDTNETMSKIERGFLLDEFSKGTEEARVKEAAWRESIAKQIPEVTENDIAEVVSLWSGVPVTRLVQSERARLLNMESEIHKQIVGQDEAVKAVADAVINARAGLKDRGRPVGSFLFLGPTGVGKTELARALAQFLYNDPEALIRLDMSEYQESHTISRLLGSPPGYVGHQEGGGLTEAVHRKPNSIVVLDEIEKAHPDIYNALLQVLDSGRMTDGKGRTINFTNTVIIMTSNLGMSHTEKPIGSMMIRMALADDQKEAEQKHKMTSEHLQTELKKTFRPEFLNRLDKIVVFRPLTRDQLDEIVVKLLAERQKGLEDQKITLDVSPAAQKLLVQKGFDPIFGARPLRRTVTTLVMNPLSKLIVSEEVKPGDTVFVDIDETGEGLTVGRREIVLTGHDSVV